MTLLFFSGCGTTTPVSQSKPEETVTINESFQKQTKPMAAVPEYRCGVWVSSHSPQSYSTITVYAKVTPRDKAKTITGFPATAVAHLTSGDFPMMEQPVTDAKGYVTFTLPIQGRQERTKPATIDVTFTINGKPLICSTFFTPQ